MRAILVLGLFVLSASPAHAATATFAGGAVTEPATLSAALHGTKVSGSIAAGVRCGRRGGFPVLDAGRGTRDGGRLRLRGQGRVPGAGPFRWTARLLATARGARGQVTVTGRLDGRRCEPHRFPVRLRATTPSLGPDRPAPAGRQRYFGRVGEHGLTLRSARGRVSGHFPVRARCARGQPITFVNLLPTERIRNGRFRNVDRFGQRVPERNYRVAYEVRTKGRFTRDGVRGSTGAAVRFISLDTGQVLLRCATGRARFAAVRDGARPALPVQTVQARNWRASYSLSTGETYARTGPPGVRVSLSPRRLVLGPRVPGTPGVTATFAAPPGDRLVVGRQYTAASGAQTEFLAPEAQCVGPGTFTVAALGPVDVFGARRSARVSFAIPCGDSPVTLTGVVEFVR